MGMPLSQPSTLPVLSLVPLLQPGLCFLLCQDPNDTDGDPVKMPSPPKHCSALCKVGTPGKLMQ